MANENGNHGTSYKSTKARVLFYKINERSTFTKIITKSTQCSATLDFWRKTTKYDDYKILQAKRRAQMNRPTR